MNFNGYKWFKEGILEISYLIRNKFKELDAMMSQGESSGNSQIPNPIRCSNSGHNRKTELNDASKTAVAEMND